jgi:hypothetical protein
MQAILDTRFPIGSSEAAHELASPEDRAKADEVQAKWAALVDQVKTIWDAVMADLVGAVDPLVSAAKGFLRWVLDLPGVRDSMPGASELVEAIDRENLEINARHQEQSLARLGNSNTLMSVMAETVGMTPAEAEEQVRKFERGGSPLVLADAFQGDEGWGKFLSIAALQYTIEHDRQLQAAFTEQEKNRFEGRAVKLVPNASDIDPSRMLQKGLWDSTRAMRNQLDAYTSRFEAGEDYEKLHHDAVLELRTNFLTPYMSKNNVTYVSGRSESDIVYQDAQGNLIDLDELTRRAIRDVAEHGDSPSQFSAAQVMLMEMAKKLSDEYDGDNMGSRWLYRQIEREQADYMFEAQGVKQALHLADQLGKTFPDALWLKDIKLDIDASSAERSYTITIVDPSGRLGVPGARYPLKDNFNQVGANRSGEASLIIPEAYRWSNSRER